MTVTAPGTSSRGRSGVRDSVSSAGAAARTATAARVSSPIVERQPRVSVRVPPTTMPTVNPSESKVPLMPSARSRCGPSGNVVVSRDMPVGTMAAAPSPWSARPVRKAPGFHANVASSEAAPKTASPVRNSRRRP